MEREVETPYSRVRLAAAMLLSTIGGVGMWSVVVVLPSLQSEFGASRGEASFPYTLTMIGSALGSVLMGRLADKRGMFVTMFAGAAALGIGYVACAFTTSLWQFALAQGLVIGLFGTSTAFGPLIADVSFWFAKRRGIAVAICACGSYFAGTIWPGIVQHFIGTIGWRETYVGIGLFCLAAMLPLSLVLRRPRPAFTRTSLHPAASPRVTRLGLAPNTLQALLCIAGVSCCVAMSMPQVHVVAYCGDLGYGVARGAEMLSLMLGFGIVSRLASGLIADRIGGLKTLILGSSLQGLALSLYLLFDGLTSLYVISALFGLFQGGIVPSYAIIVRGYFPAAEAGTRIGLVLMATMLGMALGGWMSGVIFDLTSSYQMAFLNGLLWNLLNVSIAAFLLLRGSGSGRSLRLQGVGG